MVIWPEFRMGQYRGDDYREHAALFGIFMSMAKTAKSQEHRYNYPLVSSIDCRPLRTFNKFPSSSKRSDDLYK